MKKVLFTLAVLVQSVFVFADNRKETHVVKAKHENVKVYLQAGTSTAIVDSLLSSDRITYVRKYNKTWSIVQVNGKVGYVLTSELVSEKVDAPALIGKTR